jgi:hypothetical protein
MAFLVRQRVFHDQPVKGPLASCGRSADASAVIAVEHLRRQGSRAEVITQGADSSAAMGTNLMELANHIPAAHAGFA